MFFLVPRGITAGDIELQSDRMSWNITRGSYQLMLRARIPIYNPNYLDAKVVGQLHVFFYDSEAGVESIEALKIPARSSPYVIEVLLLELLHSELLPTPCSTAQEPACKCSI